MKQEDILYKDDYTRVVKFRVGKKNQKNNVRVRMEKRPFVVIVPINKKKRVLLYQEFRSALKKKVLMVPTGFIEPNESPKQAAKREFLEESGLLTRKITRLYKLTGSSELQQEGYVFLATEFKKISNKPKLKAIPTSFDQAIRKALKNKLGDRIGLAVIVAIKKYEQ